jgi:hypothetical protein
MFLTQSLARDGIALTQLRLFLPATLTAPQRDQLSQFHVEFPFGHDFPPMKAAFAQGFTLGFITQGRFLEFNNLAHVYRTADLLKKQDGR